jgi:hypothetical protein
MKSIEKTMVEVYKRAPQKCIEQIEFCGYECQGGPLTNNVAWLAIKELIDEYAIYKANSDKLSYCVYACDGKDYNFGTPRLVLTDPLAAMNAAHGYIGVFDCVELRVFQRGVVEPIQTVRLK